VCGKKERGAGKKEERGAGKEEERGGLLRATCTDYLSRDDHDDADSNDG
jgi:hypothetical protein